MNELKNSKFKAHWPRAGAGTNKGPDPKAKTQQPKLTTQNHMTRNGKIARLPQSVRSELNRRLQEGEPAKGLAEWLNGLHRVQKVLKKEFGGRAVSEQNLCEWRAGGYKDWLRLEEARQLMSELAEEQEELSGAADGMVISDRFAAVLSVELVKLTRQLLEDKTEAMERWRCLREVLRELSQLRRDDHRALRTRINRERWEQELEAANAANRERAEKEMRDKLCAPYWAAMKLGTVAEGFGGGEAGRDIAARILEIQEGLPEGCLRGKAGKEPSMEHEMGNIQHSTFNTERPMAEESRTREAEISNTEQPMKAEAPIPLTLALSRGEREHESNANCFSELNPPAAGSGAQIKPNQTESK